MLPPCVGAAAAIQSVGAFQVVACARLCAGLFLCCWPADAFSSFSSNPSALHGINFPPPLGRGPVQLGSRLGASTEPPPLYGQPFALPSLERTFSPSH